MDVWKIFHPSNRESGYSVVKRGNPVRGLSECLRRKALSGFLLACFSSPRAIAPGNLAFRNLPLDFFRPPSFSPRSTRKLSAWRRRDFLIKFKWLWGEVKSIDCFFREKFYFSLPVSEETGSLKVYTYRCCRGWIRVNISAFVEKFLVSRIKETRERRKF